MHDVDPVLAARYRALALRSTTRGPFRQLPNRLLVVDARRQCLGLMEEGHLLAHYPISTGAAGLGCEEGSCKTPTGWHRIHACIGAGASPGTVFRNRIPTGERWEGELCEEDLILTRVLTLDGMEEGWNRGPGRDSLERTIYIHGTNQEPLIGTPVSHGCIRMGNADMVDLFDQMHEGDLVLISEEQGSLEDPLGLGRLHFVGVAGSGMSALAQFAAMSGSRVSGSDRNFDRGQLGTGRAQLERLGIAIHPQDGSGVAGNCSGVVYSTAVEESVPDFAKARRQGIPLLHRSELLAHLVAARRCIAVTGTSGKSTTVAMIFEILRGAGLDPSVITGGELRALQREGLWGNAWAGGSELLVIEADESDGSLVRYRPSVGVVMNLQRDHKEESVVADMFRTFKGHIKDTLLLGEAENLMEFRVGAMIFGEGPEAGIRGTVSSVRSQGSCFSVDGTSFELPLPGHHNIENALAAIAASRAVGVELEDMVRPLSGFQGVARRFQLLGERRGVQVIDDFGHNPAKIAASLRTAHLQARRVLAVFQPHGYGPLRFLRDELVEAFARELASGDRLWLLDVFFAGGTVNRDISSEDVVKELAGRRVRAEFAPSRDHLVTRLAQEAREEDLILVMGARDPSLTELGQQILEAL